MHAEFIACNETINRVCIYNPIKRFCDSVLVLFYRKTIMDPMARNTTTYLVVREEIKGLGGGGVVIEYISIGVMIVDPFTKGFA